MKIRVYYQYFHAVDVEADSLVECMEKADEMERAMPLDEWHEELEFSGTDYESKEEDD